MRSERWAAAAPMSEPEASAKSDPFKRLDQCLSTADVQLHKLKRLRVPRYFRGERLLWIFLALWLVGFVVSGFLLGSPLGWVDGLTGSTIGVLLVVGGLSLWLYTGARKQMGR